MKLLANAFAVLVLVPGQGPIQARRRVCGPPHWVLGVATGMAMGWWFLRRAGSGGADLVIALGLGLVLGQVVEPALEALIFEASFAAVNPVIRWELFAEFTLALMASVTAAAATTRLGRRAHDA